MKNFTFIIYLFCFFLTCLQLKGQHTTWSDNALAAIEGSYTDGILTQVKTSNPYYAQKAMSSERSREQSLPVLPIDFESEEIDYDFINFAGGELTRIANPEIDEDNPSAFVGRMVKNEGEGYGGSTIILASPIDFSEDKHFGVKVFMPRVGARLQLRLIAEDDPQSTILSEAVGTVSNQWENLIFDFTDVSTDVTYRQITIIYESGFIGDGSIFYTFLLDDITQFTDTTKILPILPLDFESEFYDYVFYNFGGGEMSKIANPQKGDMNPSNFVAQMVKNPGDVSGGSVIPLASPINFFEGNTIRAKFFMPRAGSRVSLRLENQTDESISFETEAMNMFANEWEELSFDFNAMSTEVSYQKMIFIFDPGTMGDGSEDFTYLIDDIRVTANDVDILRPMDLPVTFDEEDVNYGLVGFGGAEISYITTDPTDESNRVAKVIRSNTAESGAGTRVTATGGGLEIGFRDRVPFTSTATLMSVRVLSPESGIPVRLKMENNLGPEQSAETEAITTVAGEWETLFFNFANPAPGTPLLDPAYYLNKATIFFNYGTSGAEAGEQIFYFDDLEFRGTPENGVELGPLPTLPLDFESVEINYAFENFGGAVLTRSLNQAVNEDNPSRFVGQMIKYEGEAFAGSVIPLESPIDFSEDKYFSVKVRMPRVGAKMLIRVENQDNPEINFEREVTATLSSQWEELIFDFTAIPTDVSYQKITIVFDSDLAGEGPFGTRYMFDDLKLFTDTSIDFYPNIPIDFESEDILYVFNDFGGAELSRIANPQKRGINTSDFVARMVKNPGDASGGSVIPLSRPIDFSQGMVIRAKFFMPRAGSRVSLRVENQMDESISFETEAINMLANEWEELSFDFNAMSTDVSYQKLVFIFDPGTMGDGSADFTYLFDDIILTLSDAEIFRQMELPVTFDEEDVNYGLVGFGGAEISYITTDPTDASNRVAKVIRSNTAESWAGTTVTATLGGVETGFRERVPFTSTATYMSVRVWSPDRGIPVRLKMENNLDGGQSVETEVMTTLAGQWETLVFDFANEATGTPPLNPDLELNKATIYFHYGTTGAVAGEKIYYFDDIEFGDVTCTTPDRPVITMTGEGTEIITLTSSAQEGNQWFLNGEIILGAILPALTVTQFGIYTLQVSMGTCKSEMSEEKVLVISSSEVMSALEVKVFPNPSDDFIEIIGVYGDVKSMDIIDTNGRPADVIFEKSGDVYHVNMKHLSAGVYILRIQQKDQSYSMRIIKK